MSSFLPIIDEFNKHDVSYVIVGGMAVVLHGHVRLTADVDIVLRLDEENISKATSLLKKLDYKPGVPVPIETFSDAKQRESWISEKNMLVFSVYWQVNPAIRVDLFLKHPIDYDILYDRSELKELGEVNVRVCSINHLIQMKQTAGRPKDIEDIKVLRKIQGERQKS